MKRVKPIYTVIDPNEEGAVAELLRQMAIEKLEAPRRKGDLPETLPGERGDPA